MIRIECKQPIGFRRCGVTHRGVVDYPDDRFSFEELEILMAEPMLTVTCVEETPAPDTEAKAKKEAEAKAKKGKGK